MSEYNSEITVQRRELSGVIGAEAAEDAEILGRALAYRAGEVLVPRDWLLQRCRDLEVPERVLPSKPTPHSAYKRAMSRLVTSNPQDWPKRTDERWMNIDGVPAEHNPLKITLDLKDGEGNVNHLTADVFFPEAIIGEEGGKWQHHDLGHFDYNTDAQRVRGYEADDNPDALHGLWVEMADRADQLHQMMEEHHTGQDLRNMIYLNMIYNSPPEWPSVIPLIDKGGLYFVPEGPLSDVIDSLAVVFREANDQFKVGGAEMAIRTLEVMDSDDKREWVRKSVERSLDQVVDRAIEQASKALEDDDDVDEIVNTVVEAVDAEAHSADQYNDLLQAKLDVEAKLESRADDVSDDDMEAIIESAMDELDL